MQCLARELQEELQVEVKEAEFLTDFDSISSVTKKEKRFIVYKVQITRDVKTSAEITEIKWMAKEDISATRLGTGTRILVDYLIRESII